MTGEDDDRALREAFAQARREDTAQTPAFARVWEKARAPRMRRGRPVLRLVLAGLGILALAAVLLRRPPVHHRLAIAHGLPAANPGTRGPGDAGPGGWRA